jgi:hypothetical protein
MSDPRDGTGEDDDDPFPEPDPEPVFDAAGADAREDAGTDADRNEAGAAGGTDARAGSDGGATDSGPEGSDLAVPDLAIPRGRLRRSRVVDHLGRTLRAALESRLTGYAVVAPGDALLLGAEGTGVLTFEDGVPVLAYHTGVGEGGRGALDALAGGPCRVEVYEVDAGALRAAHDAEGPRVPPGLPAERLAGDPALAERTRERAPDPRVRRDAVEDAAGDRDAVVAFLDDEERVEAIRERARTEARRRAEEWGLDDHLDDD